VAGELTVYLVRHGESRWNAEGRLQGQTGHVPLTARGHRQARAAADLLMTSRARLVISSDLRRAVDSARPVACRLNVPLQLEPGLREQRLGAFEGRSLVDVRRQTDPACWTDASWRPPGGESLRDVYDRLYRFFRRLRETRPGAPVVVVTHGDTARVAIAVLRGLGPGAVPRAAPGNGEVVQVSGRVISSQ
jgi:broad specificity phosphatase PhoE